MFGWFNKKTQFIEPSPQKSMPEEPPVIDDWKPEHGNWFKGTFCHCGYERGPLVVSVVCPKCGHDDKWESYAARWEWESSVKKRQYCFRVGLFCHYIEERRQPWSRNAKLVRWTKDHCKIDRE